MYIKFACDRLHPHTVEINRQSACRAADNDDDDVGDDDNDDDDHDVVNDGDGDNDAPTDVQCFQ